MLYPGPGKIHHYFSGFFGGNQNTSNIKSGYLSPAIPSPIGAVVANDWCIKRTLPEGSRFHKTTVIRKKPNTDSNL